MPTGLAPTGTSFTVFSSNISVSFAISQSSCRAVAAARIFLRPAAQPRKPTLIFRFHANHDYRYVVRAAIFVCQRHQPVGSACGIHLCLQGPRNFGLRDHARQAIRAQQQKIPRKQNVFIRIHVHFRLCSQRPQQTLCISLCSASAAVKIPRRTCSATRE